MGTKEYNEMEVWFGIAADDLLRASRLMGFDDLVGAGMHIQQAIEKYLKGYLVFKGWKLKRIHNLGELLDYTVDYDSSFQEFFDGCIRITDFYLRGRYPEFISELLMVKDIEDAYTLAEKIRDKVKQERSI